VLVVKDMAEEKPEELLAVSLTRAKAAESLAPHVELAEQRSQVFLMGMFSCIDALMDMPMDRVLEELPLEEDIKTALTGGPNAFRHLLDAICAYEKGDWGQLSLAASELNLDESLMPQILRESTKWAHEALGVF
jgi:EAL and modified HD-GYP domain-containing signal transduction protein